MIVDARTLEDATEIESDVVVIGGGFAGLIVARELSGHGRRICLLESGDVTPRPEAQALAALDPDASGLAPLLEGWRQVGGTPHLWNTHVGASRPAARFLPLDPIDFEERDWVPHSGWPLSRAELDPFYERARRACGVPGPAEAPGRHGSLDGGSMLTTIEHFGLAEVFTAEHVRAVTRSPDVTVLHGATAVAIDAGTAARSATHVRAVTGPSRMIRVSGRLFVLAAGAIENARLLLLSGLGSRHDLVGRFFMDHHRVEGGRLVPSDPRVFERTAVYDLRPVAGRHVMGKLTPTEELLRRERLLNSSTLLWPRPSPRHDAAVDSLRGLLDDVRRRRVNGSTLALLGRTVAGAGYVLGTGGRLALRQRTLPPDIGRGRWSSLPRNRRRFQSFELVVQCEQAPSPDNRVTLGPDRDQLGLPRPHVTTRWSDVDVRSLARLHEVLDEHFTALGIGRVVREDDLDGPRLHSTGGLHHQLGTTRMHRDERLGVVDPDGRVHGMGNLYVTGGSVFPTGGYANPSLTIAALAIRLADHLRTVAPRPSPAVLAS
jgi:choline dehydrogenase-like flavoprotein